MAWKQTVVVVGAAAIAFVAGRAIPSADGAAAAQPTKDAKPAQPPKVDKPAPPVKPDAEAAMAEMMAQMQPGENHKRLDVMLGTWEGGVKFWMEAGGEAMESTGKVHREWAMDNRFVIEHVDGSSPGMPAFKGMSVTGYNIIEKRYESVWIENMATNISFMTGTYDAAKKSMTFTGDLLDPMTGKRQKQRHIVDLSDPSKETMIGYCTGADGKEFKNFEGSFTKKK